MKSFAPTRRTFLKAGTAATALFGFGPSLLRQAAAQDADLAPYKSAKIDWQQTSGETITVAVIPASYFENLISLAPQFKALTGIDVRFEKIPPAQIRQLCTWGRIAAVRRMFRSDFGHLPLHRILPP